MGEIRAIRKSFDLSIFPRSIIFQSLHFICKLYVCERYNLLSTKLFPHLLLDCCLFQAFFSFFSPTFLVVLLCVMAFRNHVVPTAYLSFSFFFSLQRRSLGAFTNCNGIKSRIIGVFTFKTIIFRSVLS